MYGGSHESHSTVGVLNLAIHVPLKFSVQLWSAHDITNTRVLRIPLLSAHNHTTTAVAVCTSAATLNLSVY